MKKMLIHHFLWCLLWPMVSGLLFIPTAHAGDKFIVKPIIDTAYMVDSNFYKTNADERTVSTLTVSPGMEFGYRTEKSRVSVKGLLNLVYYDDLDTVPAGMTGSDDNDFTGHHVRLSADTQLFTRVTAGIDDTWINTRTPDERDALDNFTDVNEYTINRVRPWMKYRITDRFAIGAEFSNTDIDYDLNTNEDSSQTGGQANLYYEMNKFTVIDLACHYVKMDYDLTSSDYTSRQYGINVSNQFKYFTIKGGLGYHERDFDQPGVSDIDTLSWNLTVKGQNPPDLEPDEKPRSYMALGVAQNFNDTGEGDEYYIANRVSLLLGHLFMEKLDARVNAYYQNSDYENNAQNREDDTSYVAGTLTYFMNDWITASVKAGYESRDSSISTNDYDNAFALIKITFNYDLGSR